MTEAPSPFSAHNPKLQTAWDSTSLGEFMFCPRLYQMHIVDGYRGSAVDLEFGILVHSGTEQYDYARLEGKSKDEAVLRALRWIVDNSGEYVMEHPDYPRVWRHWGGTWEEVWHCLGETKYKNAKGNAAKCPYSHKGKLFPAPGPGTCGECGSNTEHLTVWTPGLNNKLKNQRTVIRTVLWYCLNQPEDYASGLQPYAFPDGTPAIELSVKIPSGVTNKYGEEIILCGHLDRIATFGNEYFTRDLKTTKSTLSKSHFEGFSPHHQFDLYDIFGAVMFPDLNIRGVIVDAIQVLQGGARFVQKPLYRTEKQREEFLEELPIWFKWAEQCAEDDYWPMNRRNCWLCRMKTICALDPSERQRFLDANFEKAHWNPLEER